MLDLAQAATAILATPEPAEKARIARELAAKWRAGEAQFVAPGQSATRPARPARPELLMPRDMPRRKAGGSAEKRIALLHALAHIELNAIDLAWDMIARFGSTDLPRGFLDDWVKVGDEEALHFELLSARLQDLGASYGDLPAHDGLWRAAEDTAHDLLARLAIVPLVLEARGLDVTPKMIADLERFGDLDSAAILKTIYRDEIGHVAIGMRWFAHVAKDRGLVVQDAWQSLVRRHFKGVLKPPFNQAGRDAANMPADFYQAINLEP